MDAAPAPDDQAGVLTDPPAEPGVLRRYRRAFTRFRRTRPFWGCLTLALGGWFVLKPVVGGSFKMIVQLGAGGMVVYLLGGAMILAAAIAMVAPAQRHFPAIMAAGSSVASLPLANLGGWLVGMFFGIVGSGLVFAWTPYTEAQLERFAERARQRDERRQNRRNGRNPHAAP
ncbi:hypothetical protein EFK50_03600 [Nocardioides marmoriginsengisoli]|uniref:Uncharacterized protein n=1 Tax=Nocardioides marmoriginsengisoli TaxID=661483 RepID=A0A3N0CNM5_9ACTN|nr:hypothetical protein EFK50_03600 [Nocardioides marmoriginsengisoli]